MEKGVHTSKNASTTDRRMPFNVHSTLALGCSKLTCYSTARSGGHMKEQTYSGSVIPTSLCVVDAYHGLALFEGIDIFIL